ncbi:unnamed protein product [Oppiella nova]|uniref:Uncharacterized protein n=1 Tax=Oppiella nova TaxID=334625 RepID=A0A7R9MHT3_9ACAR|nr:unnamed protein product [Oppiella nova]CAG2176654.1 unnamed protein product [Oppiella nova]
MLRLQLSLVIILVIYVVGIVANNWHHHWNNYYSDEERRWARIMFCSDCEYIERDLERYNECANRHYREHHHRLIGHRNHYRNNRNNRYGHRDCYRDFMGSMNSYGNNNRHNFRHFDECFRNNVNREHIRRCEYYEYD